MQMGGGMTTQYRVVGSAGVAERLYLGVQNPKGQNRCWVVGRPSRQDLEGHGTTFR